MYADTLDVVLLPVWRYTKKERKKKIYGNWKSMVENKREIYEHNDYSEETKIFSCGAECWNLATTWILKEP
jgi:hypothetical protein